MDQFSNFLISDVSFQIFCPLFTSY